LCRAISAASASSSAAVAEAGFEAIENDGRGADVAVFVNQGPARGGHGLGAEDEIGSVDRAGQGGGRDIEVVRAAEVAGIAEEAGGADGTHVGGGRGAIGAAHGSAHVHVVAGQVDLFARRVVGWSMQARQATNVVLQALLAAVWRRKPKSRVLVHSDQGCQFTSLEWASFLKHHDLEPSMSRRGNCHDNAVAESFFNLLKRERVRRKVYRTRDEARADVFDYIEMFYNPKRRHNPSVGVSPVEFEKRQSQRLGSV
jgi:putative transposase